MDYKEIEQKYIDNNIRRYKFQNAEQVKKVMGWDFRTMRGFKDLSDEHKQMAEYLICDYLNGHGLQARESQRPSSIKVIGRKFKLTIKNGGFSYLHFNGGIG